MNTSTSGVISIGASDLATGPTFQTLAFASSRSVGTYTINNLSGLNAILSTAISGSSAIWAASLTIGSGTLVITTLTNNRFAGTFVFTLQPQAGSTATGMKVITNGVFDVTF